MTKIQLQKAHARVPLTRCNHQAPRGGGSWTELAAQSQVKVFQNYAQLCYYALICGEESHGGRKHR